MNRILTLLEGWLWCIVKWALLGNENRFWISMLHFGLFHVCLNAMKVEEFRFTLLDDSNLRSRARHSRRLQAIPQAT